MNELATQKNPSPLTTQQWQLLDVDPTVTNIELLNDIISTIPSGSSNSLMEIQALAADVGAITKANSDEFSHQKFTAIGIESIDTQSKANLLNQVLDLYGSGDKDSLIDLQSYATAVDKVLNYDKNSSPLPDAPERADFALLKLDLVTAENLSNVQAALGANNNGTIDLEGLKDLVKAGVSDFSLALLKDNLGDGSASRELTVEDFAAANITGVTSENLGEKVAAIANFKSALGDGDYDTPKVQALLDAHAVLVTATSASGGDVITPLSAADFSALGVTGVTSSDDGQYASILAQVVHGKSTEDVADLVKLQALADVVEKWVGFVDPSVTDPETAMTQSEYAAIGLSALTADDLTPHVDKANFYQQVIATKPLDEVNTLAQIKQLDSALTRLFSTASSDESESVTVLTVTDLHTLGFSIVVDGFELVDVNSLAAIQAALTGENMLNNTDAGYKDYVALINTAGHAAFDDLGTIKTHASKHEYDSSNLVQALNFNGLVLDVEPVDLTELTQLLHSGLIGSDSVDSWIEFQAMIIATNTITNAHSAPSTTALTAEALGALGREALTDSDQGDVQAIIQAAANVIASVGNTASNVDTDDLDALNMSVSDGYDFTALNTKLNLASTALTDIDTLDELSAFIVL